MSNSASDITLPQRAIASCTGALLTSIIVTPLDVVKIRLQAQHKQPVAGTSFVYNNGLMDHICAFRNGGSNGKMFVCTCTVDTTTVKREWFKGQKFHGTLHAMQGIARAEGITSLWSGLPPTLVMSVPATVIYFSLYDHLKYRCGYRENDPSTKYIPALAGAAARVAAVTVISPLEMVRTKMQSEQLSYRQVGVAVSKTINHGGVFMMMRGLGPSLLRDVPFSAMYWFSYESVKAWQLQRSHRSTQTFPETLMAGAMCGSFAALVTLPFDVVKTHRQIALGQAEMFQKNQLDSTWKIIGNLYRSQGIRALFAGAVPRLVKVAPACAIMISSYEYGKIFFMKQNTKHFS